MTQLEHVLSTLQEKGLKVSAKKSYFAQDNLKYLGFLITRKGIKPVPDKVQAMLSIAPPTNRKQGRCFIGMINHSKDMWKHRSKTLAPLTAFTSTNLKFKWTSVEQQAFDDMKKVIAGEVLLSYPDFSQPFDIHTDTSDEQIGAVISQQDKPIAFFSRKLNPAQTQYTTTEKELLAIVETPKCLETF